MLTWQLSVTLERKEGAVRIAKLLSTAVVLLAGALASPVRADDGAQKGAETFYKYTDKNGRVVITNATGQVPLEQRQAGRIDLSHVSLNSELAAELDAQLEEQHEELIDTPYCAQARQAAQVSLPQQVWDDYAPLVLCGGVLLLFGLFTPFALKRYGAPVWAKVLSFAVPTLAVVGFLTFTLTQSQKRVSALRRTAQPCEKDAFAKLAGSSDPVSAHKELIERLRREVERARQEYAQ